MPARFIGERVRVLLRGNELLVFERRNVVARHPRLTKRYGYRDVLDHYLEILLVKPGAMAGSTALAAARAEGSFSAIHEAFWVAALKTSKTRRRRRYRRSAARCGRLLARSMPG